MLGPAAEEAHLPARSLSQSEHDGDRIVLPAPFGPSRATTSPASTRKSIPERARFSS